MTQIYIISGTSWTVPSDWSNTNTIETIGGGGGGANPSANDAGGGGGGAYSKITNLSLTVGNNITIQVGTGGGVGADGGDTSFNGASLAASSVGAKGGKGATGPSGGAGGDKASGVGTTKNSGGAGGTPTNVNDGGGGGGGAGGPNGDGNAGANASGNGGGGGGGAGGGSATAGSNSASNNGGDGGTAQDGTAGGTGGAGGGSGGSHGSGGAGGALLFGGGNGGAGIEWDSTHGAGGGGGAGGHNGNGGGGGNYGGGGAGGGWSSATGGSGAQGIIVITYTPVISATILAGSRNAMEHQAVGRIDASAAVEFGLSVPSNVAVATEGRREIRCEGETPTEAFSAALRGSLIPIQWAGSLAFYTDAFMPFEAVAVLHRDTLGFVEFASVTPRNVQFRLELLMVPGSEVLLATESLTDGARISADGPLCLEWVNPPSLLTVAPERVLRSPGRVRVLAAPGSIHPLRGD